MPLARMNFSFFFYLLYLRSLYTVYDYVTHIYIVQLSYRDAHDYNWIICFFVKILFAAQLITLWWGQCKPSRCPMRVVTLTQAHFVKQIVEHKRVCLYVAHIMGKILYWAADDDDWSSVSSWICDQLVDCVVSTWKIKQKKFVRFSSESFHQFFANFPSKSNTDYKTFKNCASVTIWKCENFKQKLRKFKNPKIQRLNATGRPECIKKITWLSSQSIVLWGIIDFWRCKSECGSHTE